MSNLQQAMQRLEASLTARSKRLPAANDGQNQTDGQLALALSQDSKTATPDILAQPPLFNLVHDQRRRGYFKDDIVTLPKRGKIHYRGEELRGDDWAVWSFVLAAVLALGANLPGPRGERRKAVEFSPRSALKAMGWGVSVHDSNRLRNCLERMQATVVRLPKKRRRHKPDPDPSVVLSLIEKCQWQPSPTGNTGRWRVWVAIDIIELFTDKLTDNHS